MRPKNIPRRMLLDNMIVVERYLDVEEAELRERTSDEDSDEKSLKEWSPTKTPDKEVDRISDQKSKEKKEEIKPSEEEIKALALKIAVKKDAKRIKARNKDKELLEISMIKDDGSIDLPTFKKKVDISEDPVTHPQKSLNRFTDKGDDSFKSKSPDERPSSSLHTDPSMVGYDLDED